MPNIEQGLHLLVEHHSKIESEEVADAFFYLVGHGLSLPGWRCTAVQKGFIPGFLYYLDRQNPYSFIINENSLLFYLRKPGMKILGIRVDEISKSFSDVTANKRSEVKVRINNIVEAKRLVKLLFN